MKSKREGSQVLYNNPEGSRLSVQEDINKFRIANWKERSKMELTGRCLLLRGWRSALGCSAM